MWPHWSRDRHTAPVRPLECDSLCCLPGSPPSPPILPRISDSILSPTAHCKMVTCKPLHHPEAWKSLGPDKEVQLSTPGCQCSAPPSGNCSHVTWTHAPHLGFSQPYFSSKHFTSKWTWCVRAVLRTFWTLCQQRKWPARSSPEYLLHEYDKL